MGILQESYACQQLLTYIWYKGSHEIEQIFRGWYRVSFFLIIPRLSTFLYGGCYIYCDAYIDTVIYWHKYHISIYIYINIDKRTCQDGPVSHEQMMFLPLMHLILCAQLQRCPYLQNGSALSLRDLMGFRQFLLNNGMLLVVFIAGGLGLGKDSKTSKNLEIREKYISCSKTLNSSVISPKVQRYTKPVVCIFYAKLGSWPIKAQSLATHLLTGKECYAVCDTGYARTGVYKCESSRWNNRFSWDSKELRRRPKNDSETLKQSWANAFPSRLRSIQKYTLVFFAHWKEPDRLFRM
jgi:hypothetical protein